jgi:hypothetical protein
VLPAACVPQIDASELLGDAADLLGASELLDAWLRDASELLDDASELLAAWRALVLRGAWL